MEIIKDIFQTQWNNTAVTLGKFDGVHLGHRLLMNRVLNGETEGLVSTVFTFDQFPSQFLLHQKMTSIFTEEEKEEVLRSLGIGRYVLFPFHEKNASMEPEQFVEEILVKTMKVKQLYVGVDFRFGKNRRGDVKLLQDLSKIYGFGFEAVEKQMYRGEEISSSRIRDCITSGFMEDVTAMLGLPYQVSGKIVRGKSLGHTIGVPTINQRIPEDKIMPKLGVYCSEVTMEGKKFYGISNVGTKPTVQNELLYGLETHLFDCEENLYDKNVTTKLLHFVRQEQKFSSVKELKQQLEYDINYGKTYFRG